MARASRSTASTSSTRRERPMLHGLQGLLDDRGDRGEADPPLQERLHGDLVGGVEHGGSRTPGPARFVAEAKAREGVEIGVLEGESRARPSRERLQGVRSPGPGR